uniref:Coiled-coil domain-containing protein 132 n=1 Tax=Auxenochlorella protothecoides TaxID=3075 RepID=A0A1D1ZMS1_AUXPR
MTSSISPTKAFLGRLGRGWRIGGPGTPPEPGPGSPPAQDSPPPAAGKSASLEALSPAYQTEGSDPLDEELCALPLAFGPADLETLAEARTGVLEAVSEKLSAHVLANYDRFVGGVEGVTRVEVDVQAAYSAARMARERLALALAALGATIRIAEDTRRKGSLAALLQTAGRLQQVAGLLAAVRDCQEEGEYAAALATCGRAAVALGAVPARVAVARALEASLNAAYEETLARMSGALASVCLDFRPGTYARVLEGYLYLSAGDGGGADAAEAGADGDSSSDLRGALSDGSGGDGSTPGPRPSPLPGLAAEVQSALLAAVGSVSARVVRGVLLTRSGCEARARSAGGLQDLVRLLPSDLFRTALARLLQVLFDVLASHQAMVAWHAAALQAQEALEAGRGEVVETAGPATAACGAAETAGVLKGAMVGTQSPTQGEPARASAAVHHRQTPPRPPRGGRRSPENKARFSVAGPATLALRRGSSAREETEARARDEAEWCAVLHAVHAGLVAGRGLVWDEVARHVATLLSSPAAFEGEHFLQVMDWMQRFVAAGEAFSGVESPALRSMLQRQSGNFFAAFHASNLEALSSMLEKESWTPLPVELPGLLSALAPLQLDGAGGVRGGGEGSGEEGAAGDADDVGTRSAPGPRPPSGTSFQALVAAGNPWRRRSGGAPSPRKAGRGGAGLTLGFGGDASLLTAGLDVDERGHPRPGSNDPAQPAEDSDDDDDAGAGAPAAEEEEEDLHGDFIDEDSQSVRRGPGPGSAGGGSRGAAAVTNTSWRTMKWMRDYARLMCTLRASGPAIFQGLTELYDLYLLHIMACFDAPGLARLAAGEEEHGAAPSRGHSHGAAGASHAHVPPGAPGGMPPGGPPLPPRLERTLRRILARGVGRNPALAAVPGSALAAALGPGPRSNGGGGAGLGAASQAAVGEAGPGPHAALTASGNMYGLVARSAACESLCEVAARLAAARGPLASLLSPGDSAALDAFFGEGLAAAGDALRHVSDAGVRLLLSLGWLAEAVAGTNYALAEPPTRHQPWVDQLLRQLGVFADRVAHASGLSQAGAARAWAGAAAHVEACVLDSVARVRSCSLEGRAAMTLDVQGVAHGLRRLAPLPVGAQAGLARADAYVKAFYIPVGELTQWALAHPEYTREQILALTACIADSSGLRRKERAALLAQMEAALHDPGRQGP